jgi:hypothetical protein
VVEANEEIVTVLVGGDGETVALVHFELGDGMVEPALYGILEVLVEDIID